MATIKNFGLQGVGSVVQLGKSNGKFKWDTDHFEVTEADGTTLAAIHGKTPVESSNAKQLTTKEYVDSVASGLDPKESVRVATTVAGTLGSDFENGDVIDGVTLATNDRILIKNQVSTGENGIYTVNSSGAPTRAEDHDGTPSNEISGGNFTFVEEGATNADTGWVLSTNGVISVGQPQEWVQFSAAGTVNITGGDGIDVNTVGVNNTVSVDLIAGTELTVTSGQLGLRGGTSGEPLLSNGAGSEATFGKLDLSNGGDNVSGLLGKDHGGVNTDISAFANGSLMVIDNSGGDVDELAIGGANTVLKSDGSNPSWGAVDLTADVSGILPVANGGLGANFSGVGDNSLVMFNNGSNIYEPLVVGAANTVLTSDGSDISYDYVTGLRDAAGDLAMAVNAAAGANFQIDTASGNVTLSAVNGSTDVDIVLTPKGTGNVVMDGITFDLGGSVPAYSVLASQTTADTLVPVSATDGGGDKVLLFDDSGDAIVWADLTTVGGFAFSTHTLAGNASGGPVTAKSTNDAVTYTGGDGITLTGVDTSGSENITFAFSRDGMADTAVLGDDTVPFFDQSASDQPEYRSWTNIISDLNILTGGSGGALTASDGVLISGNDVQLDITNLSSTTIVGADELVFDNGASGTHAKTTVTDFLADLDVINGLGATGFVAVTTATSGSQAYASRTLTASSTAAEEGIVITNGDGVATNPTIGLDIANLTDGGSTVTGTDELVVYDGTNNVRVSVSELFASSSLDQSRINDTNDRTYVDTDEVAQKVVVYADDGSAAQQVAQFQTGASADSFFVFDTDTAGEVRLEADGSGSDVNIRLVPKGNGQVFIGDTGAGVIQADDDNILTVKGGDSSAGNAGDLVLEGGDGTGANNDGSVVIRPGNGGVDQSGKVCIQDENEAVVTCFEGVASAVNQLTVTNAATGAAPTIDADDSTDSNVDIVIKPKGTGVISVDGTTDYETNVTADDDIPNKKYVDDAISSGAVSDSVKVVEWTAVLTSLATVTASDSIPAGSRVLRVMIDITAASDAATTLQVRGAGSTELMGIADSDPEEALTYISDSYRIVPTAGAPDVVVGGTAGTVGSATIIVEYAVA